MSTQIYNSGADAQEMPRLIRVAPNLVLAAFVLMKLLPARYILDRARDAGRVRRGTPVIESSSGTFGLGLAIHCHQRGNPLTLVSECIDPRLKLRLEHLGARVELVTESAPVGGFQQSRLDRLRELQRELPGAYWPTQYENPHNGIAYGAFASYLAENLGRVGALVGTVGSGGSTCGTMWYLRGMFGEVKAVGVDTHGSVHFGLPDRYRLMGGLGSSIPMKNVDQTTFNEVHWVTPGEAYAATHELHRKYGLFMGPTSGAACLAARWYARRNPNLQVVAILPDEGHRYVDTVYNPEWLSANGCDAATVPDAPAAVGHPDEVQDVWTAIEWNRRTLREARTGSRTAAV